MRFDISTDNPITELFDEAVTRCKEKDAPLDVCGDCVDEFRLYTPIFAQLEVEHPPYDERTNPFYDYPEYSCSVCGQDLSSLD
jgi:hypothetical protein